ncbi:PASTA domain-containing protein [Streptomyces sp. NPDC001275]
MLLAACSGGGADTEAEPSATVTVTVTATATATATVTATPGTMDSLKGRPLAEAQTIAERAGYAVTSHNANKGKARPSGTWPVCFEDIGYGKVDLGVVEEGALCPEKDGGALTWPVIPDVAGKTYGKAVQTLRKARLDADNVEADSAYEDVSLSVADAADDPGAYTVCFQKPRAGTTAKTTTTTTLTLVKGSSCPAKKGTYKDPENDPDYTPPAANSDSSDSSSSSDSGGGFSAGCAPHTVGVCAPERAPDASAMAECKDGWISHSQHFSGTCSGHGGVRYWFQ